ncbi:autophagy protein 5 [Punica granatum]|uniref:Autophagy protein 5 n=2 Tax=Punica granatum TaxID=22663 RepID=A0A6P8DIW3_PUNGR|nr:autophagy protein 5 [Punica granatum]
MDAQQLVWKGAIPLQIHLHESEVTTLPPPPPLLVLAPRIGYLPLLVPQIRPHFSSALPPGVDTVWFEYKSLPLKWYIPTGVLFDLLCAEPERPWNLTVHFRGYPGNILIPCEGEDCVKWSFINSLKEAAYIINGNCKNVMNMSQPDQLELWRSVSNGDLEAYRQVSSKLKLGMIEDEYSINTNSITLKSQARSAETDVAGQVRTVRIPVRLYVWTINEDFEDLEDAPQIDSWDKISYLNRPFEILKEDNKCFTLSEAIKTLLPELFSPRNPGMEEERSKVVTENESTAPSEDTGVRTEDQGGRASASLDSQSLANLAEIKFVRIQGIEPRLDIPFSWVANNLMFPEYFIHVCVCVRVAQENSQ